MLWVYIFLCLAQMIGLLYIGWINHKQFKREEEHIEQQLQKLRTKKG